MPTIAEVAEVKKIISAYDDDDVVYFVLHDVSEALRIVEVELDGFTLDREKTLELAEAAMTYAITEEDIFGNHVSVESAVYAVFEDIADYLTNDEFERFNEWRYGQA